MKTAKALKAITGVLCLVTWFSSFGLFHHYDRISPTKPDPSSGKIYAENNHGHAVYLTADEKHYWYGLMVLAGALFAITGILHLHIRSVERSEMRPKDFGDQ
jgi:CDP-diglyceride synthetase